MTTPTDADVADGNVYAHDGANMLTGAARYAQPRVYVPNSESNTVDVIDPHTYRIVDHFAVGALPQHVMPAWDLRTLYVNNDLGNSLTPIDPRTGKPEGPPIPVDGSLQPVLHARRPLRDRRRRAPAPPRLPRRPHLPLQHSLTVPCRGVDHMDFTADGRYLLASCEFSGRSWSSTSAASGSCARSTCPRPRRRCRRTSSSRRTAASSTSPT